MGRFSLMAKLDEQHEKLTISLDTNPIVLDAAQVEWAISELSKYRIDMRPAEIPLPSQGAPIQVRTDPPWLLAPNAHQGGATLTFRYSGFGWVHIEMTKAMLGELETTITKVRNLPSAPSVLQ